LVQGDADAAANAAEVAVKNNTFGISDNLLSGDYASCMSAGGAQSFCESYRPMGLPHIVSVSGEMKLKIIGEVGLGSGIATGAEETIYLDNIKNIDKSINNNLKK